MKTLLRGLLCVVMTQGAVLAGAHEPLAGPSGAEPAFRIVPLYGNSYVTSGPQVRFDVWGMRGWSDPATVVSVFFAVHRPGTLELALCGKNDGHPTRIAVTAFGEKRSLEVPNGVADTLRVGSFRVDEPGYVRVDLEGLSCNRNFGEYTALLVGGDATAGGITAVPGTDEDNWPYWGRRGPSVHMNYTAPADRKIRYFYNEVTVPEHDDVLHTYYMANGFSGGYMGMQSNEPDPARRRILFSVWSAFATDHPEQIPEAYAVKLLRRGEGVHVGEFGNEGSGGQSYMYYPWEAGKTYKFITEAVPDGNERTIFTGYFCGHDGRWRLVASFMRPEPGKQTETHYTGMHSFLENFDPQMGYAERRVRFGNQWAVTTDGEWIELTEGRFTVDNTGRSGIRLDYDGGVEGDCFYLRNCGFFDGSVPNGTAFSRPATGRAPQVDFGALEAIPSAK